MSTRDKRTRSDSRICFGIVWFESEEDAQAYHREVRARDDRYNGGWLHGMECGRETRFDRKDDEGRTIEFAVTER